VHAFDSALHAFYVLTRSEFRALARAMVDLRIANTNGDALGPLEPHPILVRQGLGGAMSTGVQRLIVQYAGAANLVRLANLSSLAGGIDFGPGSWALSAFDVADGGTSSATPSAIATLVGDAGAVTRQTVTDELGDPVPEPDAGPLMFAADFMPQTTSTDSFATLDDGQTEALSTADRQAELDGLVRIENPADDSVNTIDCASCHLATPTEQQLAMPVFSFDDTTSPLAFAPDGKSVKPPTWP
jgi:hypothetical protein